MSTANTAKRYSSITIAFHWMIAALVLFMLWYGHYVDDLPRGSTARLEGFQFHFSIGLLILILSVARLVWRLMHPAPKLPQTMKTWEKVLAKAIHYLFYVFLIALPLAGWATASTSSLNIPIYFFDLFQWPWFPGVHGTENREVIHEVFEDIHKNLGWAMLGLFSLHVLAVVKHTLVDKDGIMKRMWPGK